MSLFRHIAVLAAGLLLSACASIMGGDDGTWISSEPAFVRCQLSGQGYDQVVDTPDEIILPKAAAPIRIACKANGYRDANHTLDTAIDPMIVANLVFGSSIGVLIDVINGAAEKFPERVTIHMEPKAFASAHARDQWYGSYRESVEKRWNQVIGNLEFVCPDEVETPLDCLDELKQAKAGEARELRLLEQRRLYARIRAENRARVGGYEDKPVDNNNREQ
jgi:hypothetical protein